jgi:hypothetical protein
MTASTLLYGETLVWVTFDRQRVVSAAVRSMLRTVLDPFEVRLEIVEAPTAEEASALVEQQRAGLLTLVLDEEDHAAACKSLRRIQVRRPDCVRCVYLPELQPIDDLRLLETGAQIVVHQIPCLQRLLPRLLAAAPRKSGGNHLLTSGLVDRMPWA